MTKYRNKYAGTQSGGLELTFFKQSLVDSVVCQALLVEDGLSPLWAA
jgi:hypothetical protein